MNFQQLLTQRDALVRSARLANVAFAWQRLAEFSRRAQRAQLRGAAILTLADVAAERPWPTLQPLRASSAVVEEHFTDEDLVDFADVLSFAGARMDHGEIRFCFESLLAEFGAPLVRELAAGGIGVPSLQSSARPPEVPPAPSGGRENFPGRAP